MGVFHFPFPLGNKGKGLSGIKTSLRTLSVSVMVFLSPNSRHTTVFRPRTNLPFERGVKYSSDDFVSELKKSFVRPTDEDMARSKPPLARQKSAIALEGPRGDFRTNKYAEYAKYAVRLRSGSCRLCELASPARGNQEAGFPQPWVYVISKLRRLLHTEPRKSLGTWLREISSCSCLTFLPGPAWVLLSKICKDFFSAL